MIQTELFKTDTPKPFILSFIIPSPGPSLLRASPKYSTFLSSDTLIISAEIMLRRRAVRPL